jgi:hypothetical protein
MAVTRYPLAAWSLALLVIAGARSGSAATPISSLSLSPDVTVVLGTNGQLADDHDVAVPGSGSTASLAPLGTLPGASDISGYERLANGNALLCFDTAVELPGSLRVQPGDVVRHGLSYSIELAAAANGIPPGAYCDALTRDSTGKLVLSFNVSAALPPGGFVADDEDLVILNGAGAWALYFDGSAASVPAGLDLDAAQFLANGNLALSFDGSGQVGGVAFDDEDVLEYDRTGQTWSLAYDGSAADPDWAAADVDALPEPGLALGLAAGISGLLALGRARFRA